MLVDITVFNPGEREFAESLITTNIIAEIIVLTIFVIPVTLNVLGNESNDYLKSEHIQAAIVLGASRSRIFFIHITKHLIPKMIYLFGQQMIQVLQILIHLGVFSIFLGGSLKGEVDKHAQSLIYEWTWFFENMRIVILTKDYWLILPALFLYVLLVFSIQAIANNIIEKQQLKIGIYPKIGFMKKQNNKMKF